MTDETVAQYEGEDVIFAALKRTLKNNATFYRAYVRLRLLLRRDRRYALARRYLRGSGVEIGALHLPLAAPSHARVKYVDRLPVHELRRQYPELKESLLVNVDIIDDAEKLSTIDAESQDFVIANHLLEHCENPIQAIESFLRVLRRDGILYLAVPDKRFTFDADRPITPLEHLIKDYTEGPENSHAEHFSEWRGLVDQKFSKDPRKPIETMMSDEYSIHFHVWTYFELFELLLYLRQKLEFPFEVQEFVFADDECILVMKKT